LYFETTAQIPEVEFGGKYGYMRANTDIYLNIRQCKTYKLALLYERPGQTVNNKTFIFIGYWT
jgi:hypothetical protein